MLTVVGTPQGVGSVGGRRVSVLAVPFDKPMSVENGMLVMMAGR